MLDDQRIEIFLQQPIHYANTAFGFILFHTDFAILDKRKPFRFAEKRRNDRIFPIGFNRYSYSHVVPSHLINIVSLQPALYRTYINER